MTMGKRTGLLVVVLIVLLASCTLDIRDEDGFRLFYAAGWSPDAYVVQSHDGYRVGSELYHEAVFDAPVLVENVLDRSIDVRIWYGTERRWVVLDPYGSLELEGEDG
jgi:hypothetical protein